MHYFITNNKCGESSGVEVFAELPAGSHGPDRSPCRPCSPTVKHPDPTGTMAQPTDPESHYLPDFIQVFCVLLHLSRQFADSHFLFWKFDSSSFCLLKKAYKSQQTKLPGANLSAPGTNISQNIAGYSNTTNSIWHKHVSTLLLYWYDSVTILQI